ncbi:DUF2726 domain-containing protein [Sphingomonas cavernae]|uniref:DUF2726 domain-containing protein n=1 Tax=Sphingomonas cavernae TaxID=2320861 RepID=A0A418W5Q4_9SPHN|nr:DUF2726 domain-containing protein [Sphingomonas cavernae]
MAMGAFLKTADNVDGHLSDAAFSAVNSKRVDFLLIDDQGWPRLAIEYHGSGHNLDPKAEGRMAVKRLALEKANIPLVEVPEGTAKLQIIRAINTTLDHPYVPNSQGVSKQGRWICPTAEK